MEIEHRDEKLVGLRPPDKVFEDEGHRVGAAGKLIDPGQLTTPVVSIHGPKEGGILVYHEGEKFPVKGFPFKEAVYACDTVKRAALNLLKFAGSFPARYVFAVAGAMYLLMPGLLKRKLENSLVRAFADYTYVVFTRWGVYWKPQYYCDMVREVWRVGMGMAGGRTVFTDGSQIESEEDQLAWDRQRLVRAACMILEFDDGYRYRAQDLMEEVNVEAFLRSPSKEISRVLRLAPDRVETQEGDERGKFRVLERAAWVLMKIPVIKSVAKDFIRRIDPKKLYLDVNDWYRCCMWTGWQFRGVNLEDRISARMMIDTVYKLEKEPNNLRPMIRYAKT